MENSTYLLLGTAEDRKKPWLVRCGVADAISALDEVAASYGVNFSQDAIDQLYKELDDHVNKMKG